MSIEDLVEEFRTLGAELAYLIWQDITPEINAKLARWVELSKTLPKSETGVI